MKLTSLLAALTIGLSGSAFSEIVKEHLQYEESLMEFNSEVIDENKTRNPDGSVTIKYPQVMYGANPAMLYGAKKKRGFRLFSGGSDSKYNAQGACVSQGDAIGYTFSNELPELTEVEKDTNHPLILAVNAENVITDVYVDSNKDYFKKITCFEDGQLKLVAVYDEWIDNEDDTTTFVNPRIIRGDKMYPLAGNALGVCKLFDKQVFLPATDYKSEDKVKAIKLNDQGEVSDDVFVNAKAYESVTCYDREKPQKNVTYTPEAEEEELPEDECIPSPENNNCTVTDEEEGDIEVGQNEVCVPSETVTCEEDEDIDLSDEENILDIQPECVPSETVVCSEEDQLIVELDQDRNELAIEPVVELEEDLEDEPKKKNIFQRIGSGIVSVFRGIGNFFSNLFS